MNVTCYLDRSKSNAAVMINAFVEGVRRAGDGCGIVTDGAYRSGASVFYGVTPATKQAFDRAVASGDPWYYIDNGYFGSKYQGGDYFRITKNALQHTGEGATNLSRWFALRRQFKPWRENGSHILIALQSPWWYEQRGLTVKGWLAQTINELQRHTKRTIIVRDKPGKSGAAPLPMVLADCWAVVTHSSNVAVEGLLEGIPCFCRARCAALTLGAADMALIETPVMTHLQMVREQWAGVLADNQWTLSEIKDGTAWRSVNG